MSASTQNQSLSAILFLCREVLDVEVEDLALATRTKRGLHVLVVLSMPETAALLAMAAPVDQRATGTTPESR